MTIARYEYGIVESDKIVLCLSEGTLPSSCHFPVNGHIAWPLRARGPSRIKHEWSYRPSPADAVLRTKIKGEMGKSSSNCCLVLMRAVRVILLTVIAGPEFETDDPQGIRVEEQL